MRGDTLRKIEGAGLDHAVVAVLEYKDPVMLYADDNFHCFVTGYIRRNERIFHYISSDGETWQPVGDVNQPVMDLQGWHNFFIRPASVLPLGAGYLFVYEGSSTEWYDPVYNIVTGLGFTFDLQHIVQRAISADQNAVISHTLGHIRSLSSSSFNRISCIIIPGIIVCSCCGSKMSSG